MTTLLFAVAARLACRALADRQRPRRSKPAAHVRPTPVYVKAPGHCW